MLLFPFSMKTLCSTTKGTVPTLLNIACIKRKYKLRKYKLRKYKLWVNDWGF